MFSGRGPSLKQQAKQYAYFPGVNHLHLKLSKMKCIPCTPKDILHSSALLGLKNQNLWHFPEITVMRRIALLELKDTRVPPGARALFMSIWATVIWDRVPAGRNQHFSKVLKYKWFPERNRTEVSDWSFSKVCVQLTVVSRWGLFCLKSLSCLCEFAATNVRTSTRMWQLEEGFSKWIQFSTQGKNKEKVILGLFILDMKRWKGSIITSKYMKDCCKRRSILYLLVRWDKTMYLKEESGQALI